MDIDLTEDQRMLQDSTRRFAEGRAPIGRLRRLADAGERLPDAEWAEAAEQGWIALFVPEAHGGIAEMSQGVIDAAIVAEELGRVVYAGPFLPCAVAAFALADAGSPQQQADVLPGLAAGEITVTPAFAQRGAKGGIAPGGVAVTREGQGYRLDGRAAFVEHADRADLLLVTAAGEAGVSQFLVPAATEGVCIEALPSLDLGRGLAEVHFDGVVVGPGTLLGRYGEAAEAFERQLQVALVLQAAESVGVTDRALEIALDYTQQRLVFARPIASYQAIKHRLADHVTQLEGMKAAVAHAAKAVQHGASDAAAAVSIAQSQCGRWSTEIVRDCLHLHGGIGMTWDHDIHFYLRRAVANEALWGAPTAHHERLCALAGL